MTDIHSQIHSSPDNKVLPVFALRQQEPDSARLGEAALPGPCNVPNARTITITSTRFLRLPELLARLGVCRATIYLHMAEGKFPKAVALGPRAVGWLEHEIDAWLAAKMEARQINKK